METSGPRPDRSASELIDARITELGDWRAWSHDGIICTGETYASKVKPTFFGAPPCGTPPGSSTRASTATRAGAIDLHEGDDLDEDAFTALVREAVALNSASKRRAR
jgi:hypothetical protein